MKQYPEKRGRANFGSTYCLHSDNRHHSGSSRDRVRAFNASFLTIWWYELTYSQLKWRILTRHSTQDHTASGALATVGIRHNLGEISMPPVTQKEQTFAKQRRLSWPNTIGEIQRKNERRRNGRNTKQYQEKRRNVNKKEKYGKHLSNKKIR